MFGNLFICDILYDVLSCIFLSICNPEGFWVSWLFSFINFGGNWPLPPQIFFVSFFLFSSATLSTCLLEHLMLSYTSWKVCFLKNIFPPYYSVEMVSIDLVFKFIYCVFVYTCVCPCACVYLILAYYRPSKWMRTSLIHWLLGTLNSHANDTFTLKIC